MSIGQSSMSGGTRGPHQTHQFPTELPQDLPNIPPYQPPFLNDRTRSSRAPAPRPKKTQGNHNAPRSFFFPPWSYSPVAIGPAPATTAQTLQPQSTPAPSPTPRPRWPISPNSTMKAMKSTIAPRSSPVHPAPDPSSPVSPEVAPHSPPAAGLASNETGLDQSEPAGDMIPGVGPISGPHTPTTPVTPKPPNWTASEGRPGMTKSHKETWRKAQRRNSAKKNSQKP